MWYMRAKTEYERSTRTWMGSLTVPYAEHLLCENRLRHALALQGCDFDALSEAEKFSMRTQDLGRYVTRWLKRVRKNSGAPIRYLLVVEAHPGDDPEHALNKGMPHFHILVHEQDIAYPVRKKQLQSAWPWFSNFKLAEDAQSAAYVCKYVSDEMAGRVRPSLRYGEATSTASSHSKKSTF